MDIYLAAIRSSVVYIIDDYAVKRKFDTVNNVFDRFEDRSPLGTADLLDMYRSVAKQFDQADHIMQYLKGLLGPDARIIARLLAEQRLER